MTGRCPKCDSILIGSVREKILPRGMVRVAYTCKKCGKKFRGDISLDYGCIPEGTGGAG